MRSDGLPDARLQVTQEQEQHAKTATKTDVYGNFDIILDQFSRLSRLYTPPPYAVL